MKKNTKHSTHPPLTPEAVASVFSTRELDISLDIAHKLATYLGLLTKWNARMNLVGFSDWQTILTELILDSYELADFMERLDLPSSPLALDLGAGAGIPGVPLRLFWPQGTYYLVELREKRSMFLRTVLAQLKLPRTLVHGGRAEHILENKAPVDVVLSRAFMPWPELLSFVRPFLHEKGHVLCMANTPPPSSKELSDTPSGPWNSVQDQAYKTSGKPRYFWALRPA